MVDQLLARGAEPARSSSRALDSDTLSRFVRDGYITVQTSLPRSFHADLCQRAGAILDREGNWGNNILPRLPVLQHVLDDPPVAGALASLLGPTYVLHPHRYCHRNEPAAEAVPDLVRALHDDDRYVSAWAAIALRRVGTPEATSAVLDHLLTTRWCATTTTDNRY